MLNLTDKEKKVRRRHYKGFRDKVSRGELEHRIATGGVTKGWNDEDPNAVF
jgi:hypothetical protein